MNRCQKNAHDCLFRSTKTCFSLYRWQGPKPGECQYVEFNQLIGYGVIDDYQHFFFNRKDILAEPLQLKSIFSQQSQNGAT